MLYPLFLSLLVTLATGYPRSKGKPISPTFEAQSGQFPVARLEYSLPAGAGRAQAQGTTFQQGLYAFQPTGLPNTAYDREYRAQEATFQVDPNTLQATRVDGTLNPAGQQNVFSPQPTLNNVVPQPSPNPQAPVNPPYNPQSAFQNPPNSLNAVRLPARNTLPTGNAPVPGAVEMAKRLIGNPPGGALLVGSNPPLFPIEKRLISNYTKLRPVVTDTFRCNPGVVPNYVGYGYYADVDNDCQIFHICLPWKELYPKQFDQDVTYQFSFICPNQTVFSQDVMTCTWESEALPCEASPELYWLNQNFFRRVPGEFGMKYAAVNEKIVPPLVYDYDEFNPPKPAQG